MKSHPIFIFLVILMILLMNIPSPSLGLKYGKNQTLFGVDASSVGERWGDWLGYSVACVGDVNGDRIDDFLVSAIGNDQGGLGSGKTYLIFGKSTGWTKDVNISKSNASFIGEHQFDQSGYSIAGTGDVNGDGFDDFLIGAPYNSQVGSNSGKVYLIFGKQTGWQQNVSLIKADASFIGNSNFRVGSSVAAAGDVNGDGFEDLLIGAPSTTGSKEYLIFGKASGWSSNTSITKADASFLQEGPMNFVGASAAGAGDVNGDGFDDFLVGADGNSEIGHYSGKVYLILGKASGWALNTSLSAADASFRGEVADDGAGYSLAGAGDINGDGLDDFLIGAPFNDQGGNTAGQTYLIFGKHTGWAKNASLANANASFVGGFSYQLGMSLACAGDVNGDGFDDIVISAVSNFYSAGTTFLVLGNKSGWGMDSNIGNADASFNGENNGDYSGFSIASAGDLNHDGIDDIIIGAYQNSGNGNQAGKTYVIFEDSNSEPTTINTVKAYSKTDYSVEVHDALIKDIIYVELRGNDGNSSHIDTAIVNVTSNISSTAGFQLRLIETGKNTGIYQGNFTVMNRTSDRHHWINASNKNGEVITISSVQDPLKNTTIYVGPIKLLPIADNKTALEDQPYNSHYWTTQWLSAKWTFQTNASWLVWNSTSHNISGIPDNGDVGNYFVSVNVTDPRGGSDEHNFTLSVKNVPPKILTKNVLNVLEDKRYSVDYNSSDDGQGAIHWHLLTNASKWLSIDSSSGYLNGTPANGDVGTHYVNVSVDDGNGGRDWTNFTLTVINMNDPPIILTKDVETTYEDALYLVQYKATDIDVGDSMTWTLSTNASGWLTMNATSGRLSGTPVNKDVGHYWVNVTVKDRALASDHHNFTLTVINTNDPPSIISQPITNATALFRYVYKVEAVDIDSGDVLQFSLETAPSNMHINAASGLIMWVPTIAQIGKIPVTVMVTDSHSPVLQSFNITVSPPSSYPPQTTLLAPYDGEFMETSSFYLSWYWEDQDSTSVKFDVYIGEMRSDIEALNDSARIGRSISDTNFLVHNMKLGSIFYWTVIPNDGINVGDCTSGIWSFTIDLNAITNIPPTITSQPITTAQVGVVYRYNVTATDPDVGDTLTYSLIKKPDGMKIDSKMGIISWTPTETQIGKQSLSINVSDGKAAITQSFDIVVLKKSPGTNNQLRISHIPDLNISTRVEWKYQVIAWAPNCTSNCGSKLIFSLVNAPSGMNISSTGEIRWTPSNQQTGVNKITVKVTDGKDNAETMFNLTVEKGKNNPGSKGLTTLVLGTITALVLGIVCIIIAILFSRRKKKGPVDVTNEPSTAPVDGPKLDTSNELLKTEDERSNDQVQDKM